MSRKYKHGEAFCLMNYASDDRKEFETLWNSRDGVTPFMLLSKSGRQMRHIDWRSDRCVPDHKPEPGDRIFVDATREMYERLARKRVEEQWNAKQYPMRETFESKEAAIEMFLADWTKPGSPAVVEVQSDGSYKHAE